MTQSRLRPATIAVVLTAPLIFSSPAIAQDFFDWLEGKPPPKKEQPFKGDVPEAVQRDTLPEITPPPQEQPASDTRSPGASARTGPDAYGEPVPRGPAGETYDDSGQPYEPGEPQAESDDQFDPLEARRARSQGGTAPARANSEWRNPDETSPRRPREQFAPGTYEADREPPDARDYDRAPVAAPRQSMTAPPRGYDDDGRDQVYDPSATTPRRGPDAARDRGGYDEPPRYAPRDPLPGRVQRDNLDGPRTDSGAPNDPWAGIAIAELEETLSKLDLPPRSPTLHELWLRLITARTAGNDPKLAAVRADALNRTGMTREAADALSHAGDVSAEPVMATLAARTAIGAGKTEQGCETARALTSAVAAKMPPHLKGEVILIAGFCAAATDNKPAAGIAGDLAIENGLQDHAGPAALKALAAGQKPAVESGKNVSLLDYRILQLGGPVDLTHAVPTASPALLAVLARDSKADPATRLAAAEAAAGLNAISLEELRAAYRSGTDPQRQVELSDAAPNAGHPLRRAELFAAAETERTPARKARIVRAFLDEARRAGFYWAALQLMSQPANDIQPTPEIGWFAETAIEASLAGGDFANVHRWANFASSLDREGRADLRHWLALADIAEPNARDRSQHLVVIEELAQRGRFDASLLHRLATALDALDTQVPMPLWEAASRTEQPSTGHLPDTGVLSQLQDAAKQRNFSRTVLLTLRTIGPNGAEGAHMIALGDSIRALKRAGLEPEARRLALEALFASWPRANNT